MDEILKMAQDFGTMQACILYCAQELDRGDATELAKRCEWLSVWDHGEREWSRSMAKLIEIMRDACDKAEAREVAAAERAMDEADIPF